MELREDTLVQCILASLLPGDSVITPPKESMFIQLDGTVRLEVQVGGDKFILGDHIVGPQRDHLVGRATAVHLARRHTDTTWTCCFKTAWPYSVRPHEGEVLETLQSFKENCSTTPTSWNPTMIKTTNESSQTTKAEFFIRSARLRPEIGSFAMVDQWVERRARIVMR